MPSLESAALVVGIASAVGSPIVMAFHVGGKWQKLNDTVDEAKTGLRSLGAFIVALEQRVSKLSGQVEVMETNHLSHIEPDIKMIKETLARMEGATN